jgi:hypothetical protein
MLYASKHVTKAEPSNTENEPRAMELVFKILCTNVPSGNAALERFCLQVATVCDFKNV